jgi:ketosteroid isomerase-like protein
MGRKLLYCLKVCVCWFLFVVVVTFFGCAGPRIVMKPDDMRMFIDDARDSVALAREAGASELAPTEIARAESHLKRSEEAAKEKKRGAEAVRLASEARAEAEVAQALSKQVKEHKQEIQRISEKKAQEIAALESAQKAAIEAESRKAKENAQAYYEANIQQLEWKKKQELIAASDALKAAEEKASRIRQEQELELAVVKSDYKGAKDKLEIASREAQVYSEKIQQMEKEKEEALEAAKAALETEKSNVRRLEARAKAYPRKIAAPALEREPEKEIAIHIAKEEATAEAEAKARAEAEAKKEVVKGKASLETLEEVREAIEGLRIAWQSKDPDKYMSYYADDVKITKAIVAQGRETVRTLSKSEMRTEMERIFSQGAQFKMGEPDLEAGSDAVRVTISFFKQTAAEVYEGGERVIKQDMWVKELLFRKVGGKWKIVNVDWKLYQDIPKYPKRKE